ncbi:MAG: hypothetical protein WCX66_00290 [archaeon]
MKKIILIILILTLLFGCVEDDASFSVVDENVSFNLVFDQNASQINSVDVNMFSIAKSTKDFSICKEIIDFSIKSRCFFEFAIDLNDFNICKEIDSIPLRLSCERILFDSNK